MKTFLFVFVCISFFLSCNSNEKKGSDNSQINGTAHKGDRAEFMKGLLAKSTGLVNDSIFIWNDTNLVEFKNNKIVRIKNGGFYKYYFWNMSSNTAKVVLEDSIPAVEFLSDSLYDVNNDSYNDLLIKGQYTNGQCPPRYASLYCYDRNDQKFSVIPEIGNIPNPQFVIKESIVLGEIECMMKKDIYKFKWNGLKLDTIYIKTSKIEK